MTSIKSFVSRIVRILFVSLSILVPFLWHRTDLANLVFGVVTISIIAMASSVWTPHWKELHPLMYTHASIGLWYMLESHPVWWVHKTAIWRTLSASDDGIGLIDTIIPVVLAIGIATATYKTLRRIRLNSSKRSSLFIKRVHSFFTRCRHWINTLATQKQTILLILVFAGSGTAILLLYSMFQHGSFQTFAWDHAIFEQALFMLSQGEAPTSTVRQISNLFFDHQHMSMTLLAPLYWFGRSWGGYLTMSLSTILIYTIPTIVLWRAGMTILQSVTHTWNRAQQSTLACIILSVISIGMLIHPNTLGGIRFSFHATYLTVPIIAILFWIIARLIIRKTPAPYLAEGIIVLALSLIWTFSKEDQWVFVIAFFLQAIVLIPLTRRLLTRYSSAFRTHLKSQAHTLTPRIPLLAWIITIASFLTVYPVVHATHVLPSYQFEHHSYTFLIEDTLEHTINSLKDGDIRSATQQLELSEEQSLLLYQQMASFSLPGFIVFPVSMLGDLAERLLIGGLRTSTFYHYGVTQPIFTSIGIIAISLLLVVRSETKQYVITSDNIRRTAVSYLFFLWLGVGSFIGSTFPPPLFFDVRLPTAYMASRDDRAFVREAQSLIGIDDSIVGDETLIPHFAARQYVAVWPDTHAQDPSVLQPGSSLSDPPFMINQRGEYEWWIMRIEEDHPPSAAQAEMKIVLLAQGYTIELETTSLTLLHNPHCSVQDMSDCRPSF